MIESPYGRPLLFDGQKAGRGKVGKESGVGALKSVGLSIIAMWDMRTSYTVLFVPSLDFSLSFR